MQRTFQEETDSLRRFCCARLHKTAPPCTSCVPTHCDDTPDASIASRERADELGLPGIARRFSPMGWRAGHSGDG